MDFRSNYVLVPARGFLFIALEKCASTTAKRALRRSLEVDGEAWETTRDRDVMAPATLGAALEWKIAGYYKATIVRNPFSRIASAYRSKIRPERVNLRENGGQFTPGMSFRSFVRAIAATPESSLDRHLAPQTKRLLSASGVLRRDVRLLRFENLADDWSGFQDAALWRCKLDIPPLEVMNASAGEIKADSATLRLVRKIYEADFRLLRYDPENTNALNA